MMALPDRYFAQATGLTIVAGIADAVGYITMGGVFAANMTGNTVLAGIAVAGRDYPGAWRHAGPLLAFFLGAMLSCLLVRLANGPIASLLLQAALFAGVGFLDAGPETAVLILAVAMGLQATAITRFGGVAVSTVVVTSTLARTAEAALDTLWPGSERPPPSVANPRLLALTWIGYLTGAIAGTLLIAVFAYPLPVPAALLLLILLLCR